MTDEIIMKRREINKKYRDLFGYIPSPSDYACTSKEFFDAVEKAATEKKEIDNYLKKCPAHADGIFD